MNQILILFVYTNKLGKHSSTLTHTHTHAVSQGYARMSSEIGSEHCMDWGASGLGGVFSVDWICKESLPFQFTHQLLNPWNDNKKVQISRDGQVGDGQDRYTDHRWTWCRNIISLTTKSIFFKAELNTTTHLEHVDQEGNNRFSNN